MKRWANANFFYDPFERVVRIANEYIADAKTHKEGRDLAREFNAVLRLHCDEDNKSSKPVATVGKSRSARSQKD